MDKVLLAVKYVEGDLNEREYVAFEEAVKYDNELREYVSSYIEVNRQAGQHLKEMLTFSRFRNKSDESLQPYVTEKITYNLDYLWFAAWGIAFLIALMVWKPWKTDLYNQFGFDHKAIASTLIKAPYQDFKQAAQFLEKKDYYQAKLIVAKTFIQNPENFKLASSYAMILIADNRLETSREILYPFAEGNSVDRQEAAYILALSFLKAGDTENCKLWLDKITSDSSKYHESLALLTELNAEAAGELSIS